MRTQSASAGKRLVAYMIDSLVISVLAGILYGIAAVLDVEAFYVLVALFHSIFYLFYFTLLEGSSGQASLGKRVMNIKVVSANGTQIGYLEAFLRALCMNLSTAILFIGVIMCLFTEDQCTLHDMITKTCVTNADGATAPTVRRSVGRRGDPVLVCLSGVYAGCAFPVTSGIVIGTDPTVCQVVLPAGGGVSRNHCKLSFDTGSGMFVLHDMGSTNGTYLENGQRIPQGMPYALTPGTRFYLASRANCFEAKL